MDQFVSRLLPFAVMAVLAGCASSNVQFYEQIDPTDKTITLPPGSSLLLGPIKQSLRASGWRIAVERGPVRTVGTLGVQTDLETGITFKTRYRLALTQRQVDVCLGTGLPMVAYDLSLIDNRTGEEIMTASGRDCVDLAARWFSSAVGTDGQNYCTSSIGRFCSHTVSGN
jgi:hypothetical protein